MLVTLPLLELFVAIMQKQEGVEGGSLIDILIKMAIQNADKWLEKETDIHCS